MSYSLFFATALAILALCALSADADEPDTKPITIPLKDIWAWEMPGTRRIAEIDVARGPKTLVEWIRSSALGPQEPGLTAGQGFAVKGKGRKALREAYMVLVEQKESPQKFSTENEISVVFFVYQSGRYVHLQSVEKRDNNIVVTYQFVPHLEAISMEGIALIPLGKLKAGKYHVDFVQAPLAQEFINEGAKPFPDHVVRRIVCKPFGFVVK